MSSQDTIQDAGSFGMALHRLHMLWRTVIDESVASLGFTQTRWVVLIHLQSLGEGCTQKELAQDIGIELPSVLRTLAQLEEQGWIERRTSPTDRRARQVWLTDHGRQRVDELEQVVAEARAHLLAGIPTEAVVQMRATMRQIERNARARLKPESPDETTSD